MSESNKYTFQDFSRDFPDDKACFDTLISYLDIPKCPCGKEYKYKSRTALMCSCGKRIYPLKGTIFENSQTSLRTWLYVIYLFSQSKSGVSAAEIRRQTGVTEKCAWRMGHQVRKLMYQDTEKLGGIVEADEAYFGGDSKYDKKLNPGFGRGTKKACIFGVVERGGSVRAEVIQKVNAKTIWGLLVKYVKLGSCLMTDDYAGYRSALFAAMRHYKTNHSKRHYGYKIGDLSVHSNTIEGFWAWFKGGCRGTHRYVSRKYLQSYLDQWCFQYNHRHSAVHPFWILVKRSSLSSVAGGRRI